MTKHSVLYCHVLFACGAHCEPGRGCLADLLSVSCMAPARYCSPISILHVGIFDAGQVCRSFADQARAASKPRAKKAASTTDKGKIITAGILAAGVGAGVWKWYEGRTPLP